MLNRQARIKFLPAFLLTVILVVVAIPIYLCFIDSAKATAGLATVRMLNNKTEIFKIDNFENEEFNNNSNSDDELLNLLVNELYIEEIPVPQSKDVKFSWSFEQQTWSVANAGSFYIITLKDGLFLSNAGRLSGSYSGAAKNILIPSSLSGITIRDIYQDSFRNKGLVEVDFKKDSNVRQIHARAFLDNKITKVQFPDSLEKIDLWSFRNNSLTELNLPTNLISIEQYAFSGNNLQKISIGSKVTTIQNQALGSYTDQFKTAYNDGGAGTYVLIGGVWKKQ